MENRNNWNNNSLNLTYNSKQYKQNKTKQQ